MLPHSALSPTAAIVRYPLTVAPDTPVLDAIAQMSRVHSCCPSTQTLEGQGDVLHIEARASCVIVLEENTVTGILTERDIIRLSHQESSLHSLQVKDVMSPSPIMLHESAFTDVFGVINLLQQHQIRHLPLLDEAGHLTGLITPESLQPIARSVELLRLRLVEEVMTCNVVCASPEDSLQTIAQRMSEHQISSVVIVEPKADPQPLGILTERDLVQFQALGLKLNQYTAQAVMSQPLFVVNPQDTLWTVQKLMEEHLIHRVGVTGETGELVGLITQTNLLYALNPLEVFKLATRLEKKVTHLEAENVTLPEIRASELERQVEIRTKALQQQAEREKLLGDIASNIRSSLSLETILETTVTQVRQLLKCDRVNIWQFKGQGQRVQVVAESSNSSFSLMNRQVEDPCFNFGQELINLYRQGYIRVVSDINTTEMADCHREMLQGIHTRAKILVPLLCKDQLWGLLNATESEHPRDWTPEEVELLRTLSVHLAIALQQATTHQQLQEELQTRQKIEDLLRDSEQRYMSLTEAVPVGIFRSNIEGNTIYANDYCEQLSGLPVNESLGTNWQKTIHPEDRAKVIQVWQDVVQNQRPRACEHRFLHPNGTVKWVYVQIIPEQDAEGQISGYVGTIIDISDRKQADLALQKLIEGTVTTGEDFFMALVQPIAQALNVDYVIVSEWKNEQLHFLATWGQDNPHFPLTCDLLHTNTPCAIALREGEFYCEHSLKQRIPHHDCLAAIEAESYLGIALKDVHETVIGLLCIFHSQPLENPQQAKTLLRIFASRAEAELERLRAKRDLEALNEELEQRIEERTIQLQDVSERLQLAVKSAEMGIWDWDIKGDRLTWDQQMYQLYGIQPQDFTGNFSNWENCLHPEDRDYACQQIQQAIQGEQEFVTAFRIIHPNGSVRWIEAHSLVQWNAQGEAERMIGVNLDITDYQQADQQRQEFLQELSDFKLALDQAAIVAITDLQGVITYANDRFCEISGYSREELLGQTHRLVKSDYHPPEFFQDLWNTIHQGKIWRGEVCNRAKNGSLYWMESTILPFINDQSQPFQYLAIRFDITARKFAENAIQKENAFRQQIMDNMAEGLCVCHEVEHFPFIQFTVWNPQIEAITGYSLEEINRLGWYQSLYPDPDLQAQAKDRMAQMRQNRPLIAEEWEIQQKNGKKRTIAITTSLLSQEGRQDYVLAIIQDITERQKTEQERQRLITALQHSNNLLKAISQAQSQFITAGNRLTIFEELLENLLELTESEYGFIGEVLFRDDGSAKMEEGYFKLRGVPYLKSHSITNIAWNEETRRFYEENYEKGMEFENMNTLFGAVVLTGEAVIANRPSTDPRRGGTPEGHPPLNAFLGLPFFSGSTLVGIVGIANRPGGYDEGIVNSLKPFLATCSHLIEGYRLQRYRERAEREMAQQLASIEAAVDGITILDQEVYQYVNHAHLEIFGYEYPEELVGQSWRKLYSDSELERFDQEIFPVLMRDRAWSGEAIAKRKDGSMFIQGLSLTLTEEGLFICVCRDISEAKLKEQTIRQQAQREKLLREITQRIRQSLDLQTIFETACEEIRQVIQADRVGIFKFYPNSHYSEGEFVAESVVEGFVSVVHIPVHDHCFGESYAHLYAKGRYYAIHDIYDQSLQACHTDILAQFQVRANLIMPLLYGETLWGLLCIHQCSDTRDWQQSEIKLIQQLANQLAIAIQQASFYEQIQSELLVRQQAEAKIALQLRQQTALGTIAQRIRESLDISEILATVTEQVQNILHCDRVIVFRLFPDGHSAILEEAVSPGFPALKNDYWEDETWSAEVLEYYWQGKPRIVPDVMKDIWTDCLIKYNQEGQIKSKIVAPILQSVDAQNPEQHRWVAPSDAYKLWGILVVHACQEQQVWQESEAQLLQQIANWLSIAIQQTGLFEQLQGELRERQQAQHQLTERNEQLAVSNEELARATRLKDEFLANMSHELRTPLNAILGMAEGLQEQVFGKITPRQNKALKTIERSGTHLLTLINDILDVAKIESGKITLELSPTAIAPLCQSSLTFIQQQALKKNIQLKLQVPPNLPELWLDERRIRQVLINLLNNAVKFTPEGGLIVLEVSPHYKIINPPDPPPLEGITRVRVYQTPLEQELGLSPQYFSVYPETPPKPQHFLRIIITDTGIGISPDHLDKLFQPFIQIDSALNRQYNGTGLGLALVKRLVELHGGEVGVTSKLGVGSSFSIELPYTRAPSAVSPQASPPENPPTTPDPENSPLLLIAEDNEINIHTLVSYLEAKKYQLIVARDGEEAIALAREHHPDLILMDIQMPKMDGLTAMELIRQDPDLQHIPIIALTALAMEGDRERCLAAGANDYLTKPVHFRKLTLKIQELLTVSEE